MTYWRILILASVTPGSKENLVYFFLNLLSNYSLCHLLESPHRGDSNNMPQCIVSWNGIENISNPFYLNLDQAVHM